MGAAYRLLRCCHNRISDQRFCRRGAGYLTGMPTRSLPLVATAVGVAVVVALGTAMPPQKQSGRPFGVAQTLTASDGTVARYTVTQLGPSIDPIPVTGRLFAATVTVQAVRGSATPLVGMFYARAAGGLTYPVLGYATTAQGLSRDTLKPGEKATGRIYFNVVADTPNSVVCNNGMADLMRWDGISDTTPGPPPAPERTPRMPTMQPSDTMIVPA